MTVIWCMVPEIWSATEVIFCHFGPVFALLLSQQPEKSKFWKNEKRASRDYHFTNLYQKWKPYNAWFLRYWAQRAEFSGILYHFLPFYALNNLKNENFEKFFKKAWKYSHFTHVCHKWQSYDVWFLTHEEWQTEFFVILDCSLPFYSTNNPKNQNFGKLKKTTGDIIILHKCTKNHDHTLYCSLDMTCNRPNCYFSFWAIFCLFVPLTARKIKINKKLNKAPQDIIILQ